MAVSVCGLPAPHGRHYAPRAFSLLLPIGLSLWQFTVWCDLPITRWKFKLTWFDIREVQWLPVLRYTILMDVIVTCDMHPVRVCTIPDWMWWGICSMCSQVPTVWRKELDRADRMLRWQHLQKTGPKWTGQQILQPVHLVLALYTSLRGTSFLIYSRCPSISQTAISRTLNNPDDFRATDPADLTEIALFDPDSR